VTSQSESIVRDYYDKNTRWFLLVGGSHGTRTIHRAVWLDGVKRRRQALDASNQLVASQARELWKPGMSQPLRVLDLGCGVGGSLFSLVKTLPFPLRMMGVTISPLQVRLAEKEAHNRGLMQCCEFIEADFLHLPSMQPANLVFAIESFVQAAEPQAFFSQACRVMQPGGRLVVIDTFLTPEGNEKQDHSWIQAFRSGWHAESLMTADEASTLAETAGLSLRENRDLTPNLQLGAFFSRLKLQVSTLAGKLKLKGTYWESLAGGCALEQGQAAGLFAYRMLVFERKS